MRNTQCWKIHFMCLTDAFRLTHEQKGSRYSKRSKRSLIFIQRSTDWTFDLLINLQFAFKKIKKIKKLIFFIFFTWSFGTLEKVWDLKYHTNSKRSKISFLPTLFYQTPQINQLKRPNFKLIPQIVNKYGHVSTINFDTMYRHMMKVYSLNFDVRY
jgi:hypothetical protein